MTKQLTPREVAGITCGAPTKSGRPCRAFVENGQDRCNIHARYGSTTQEVLQVPQETPEAPQEPEYKAKRKKTGAPGTPDEKWNKLLEALRNGAGYSEATRIAGIPYRTFNDRRKNDPTFAELAREAYEEIGVLPYQQAIENQAKHGHVSAAMKVMAVRQPKVWGEKAVQQEQRIEIDVSDRIASIMSLMEKLAMRGVYPQGIIEAQVIETREIENK